MEEKKFSYVENLCICRLNVNEIDIEKFPMKKLKTDNSEENIPSKSDLSISYEQRVLKVLKNLNNNKASIEDTMLNSDNYSSKK